jgi:hypothetical protein
MTDALPEAEKASRLASAVAFAARSWQAETIIVSYGGTELSNLDRAGSGRVNDLTREAFEGVLRQSGFPPNTVSRFGGTEVLMIRAPSREVDPSRRPRSDAGPRLHNASEPPRPAA